MNESIRNTKSRDELSENSRDIRETVEMYRFKKIYILFCLLYIKWLKLVLKYMLRTAFIK